MVVVTFVAENFASISLNAAWQCSELLQVARRPSNAVLEAEAASVAFSAALAFSACRETAEASAAAAAVSAWALTLAAFSAAVT